MRWRRKNMTKNGLLPFIFIENIGGIKEKAKVINGSAIFLTEHLRRLINNTREELEWEEKKSLNFSFHLNNIPSYCFCFFHYNTEKHRIHMKDTRIYARFLTHPVAAMKNVCCSGKHVQCFTNYWLGSKYYCKKLLQRSLTTFSSVFFLSVLLSRFEPLFSINNNRRFSVMNLFTRHSV